ncbi:MAG: VWA domain-containing protein [Oligoflexia bacterium]|nr:VWA domain-containing protein [Oligoflexia bacterium]
MVAVFLGFFGLSLFWLLYFFKGKEKFEAILVKKYQYLTTSLSRPRRQAQIILQCLVLFFVAVALARPLMGSRRTEIKQTGLEIIFAIDVSNSMLAEDDKPSRLEHAKHELSHLLDLLSSDRVGVIAFAGSAALISPMTTDYSAIKMYVNSLSTTTVSQQGTNFKAVIEEAISAFERGGMEGADGTQPTRVLLIASDGEDNEPGGISMVKKALDKGIRVFTLGFGSYKGAPIPIRDDRGNLKGYKKDDSGQPVLSVPSDEGLSKIARAGNGAFYHATFDEAEVRSLISDFDKLQKADFKTQFSTDFDEKFQIPLFLAFILAIVEILVGDKKRSVFSWKGRFATGVSAT